MFITGLFIQLLFAAEPALQTLSVPRDVWDVTARDLNGDGNKDLIAFYGERENQVTQKGLYIFIARADGAYPQSPTLDYPLDINSGNAFFTNRDGKEQIVVLTESGATQYRFERNMLFKSGQVAFKTLFPTRTREPIFLRYVSFDLDYDESDEWVIPVLGGFDVWSESGKRAYLEADMRSEAYWYGGLTVDHFIPTVHAVERPGYAEKSIGFVSRRGAVFHFGKDWKKSYRFELEEPPDEQWDRQVVMADINNDSYPDLMVTNTQGTANIEVRTEIYFANALLMYPGKPAFQMNSKGGLATPFLVDLNKDEKLDLVVRGFPLTLRNIASYLFRKKISMKVETYTFNGDVYSQKPSFSNSVTAEVSDGREEVAYTYGDYDGDGAKDMAVGALADSLTILTHNRDGKLSNRAWKTIDVHTFGIARSTDLDDSGTDDIIIFHPRGKYQKDIEVIRF